MRCVWCDEKFAEAEEDTVKFSLGAGEGFDPEGEDVKDTEEGTKLRFECPECGTANVLLARIFGS